MAPTRTTRSSRSLDPAPAPPPQRQTRESQKVRRKYSYLAFRGEKYGKEFKSSYDAATIPEFRKTPDPLRVPMPTDDRPNISLKHLECIRVLGKGCDEVYLATINKPTDKIKAPGILALKSMRKAKYRGPEATLFLPYPPGYEETMTEEDTKVAVRTHLTRVNGEREALVSMPWSPWVAGMLQSFHDRENLYLGLEYIPGGTLRARMVDAYTTSHGGGMPIADAQFYYANIVMALEFLGRHSLVHGDLKPENILVGADGYLVLTDFGRALHYSVDSSDWKGLGTVEYMPPESTEHAEFKDVRPQDHPDRVDLWSSGIILYEMVTGYVPFSHPDVEENARQVCEVALHWPEHFTPGRNLHAIVSGLLTKDPKKRLRINPESKDEILDVRKHQWLKAVDWDRMKFRDYLAPWTPPARDATKVWQTMSLPKQRWVPGLKVVQPSILMEADDRFPEARSEGVDSE